MVTFRLGSRNVFARFRAASVMGANDRFVPFRTKSIIGLLNQAYIFYGESHDERLWAECFTNKQQLERGIRLPLEPIC